MTIRDIYQRHDGEAGLASRRRESEASATAGSSSLASVLWRRKLLILACLVLCLGAGAAYIAMTPPRYLASASMLIDPRLGKTVGSDPVQPGFVVDPSAIDSQVKLFTSQTVLERVAKAADLAKDPEFDGSQRSLIRRILHPTPLVESGVDLKALEDAITIKRPERTYVVTLEILARDPKKAAEIANDLTQAYIDDQISSRVVAARDDTQFVRQRLDTLSGQIKDAETKVEAFKTKNHVVDSSGLRFNEQQVTDLTKTLGEARARASETKARYDAIKTMARRGRLDASSEAMKSQTIERLRQSQADTDQTVAKLAKTLGEQHPELREARSRKSELDGLIRDELKRLELAAASEYQAARTNETQILASVDRLKGQSTTISRDLVPLEQLERNVKVLRASFDRLASVNDNLAQQQGESPPGRVIAVARPPVSPAEPKKTVVGLVSLAAGLFLGLAAAVAVDGAAAERRLSSSVVRATPEDTPPPPRPAPRNAARRFWDDDDDGRA